MVRLCSYFTIGRRHAKKKRRNKITQMSFCLLSACPVSGWMTMTTHIPLCINGCASVLWNKRKPEKLISEMKRSLCCQISRAAPRGEVWNGMALVEPWMWRLDRHVTICPSGVPAAKARVSPHRYFGIFLAPWCLAAFSACGNARTSRSRETQRRMNEIILSEEPRWLL